MRILDGWLRWLWQRYLDRLACAHFCAFKAAGSTLQNTHVHVLPTNPAGATGLGHDDETNNNDPGHTTVSDAAGSVGGAQAEDDASLALRQQPYMVTLYFHESADAGCPPGWRRVRCRCGGADVWVCYTTDHPEFDSWYAEQQWPHRVGRYARRPTPAVVVTDASPGTLGCPGTTAMWAFHGAVVPSCDDYGGPDDGENPVVDVARATLQAAVDRIGCASPCTKTVTETFRGWRCKKTVIGTFVAEAHVQWTVHCT